MLNNLERGLQILQNNLLDAMLETFYMVGVSILFAVILGGFIGLLLFLTGNKLFSKNIYVYQITGFIVNVIRSLPFIILLFVLTPVAVFIAGTRIGWEAASVSLSISSVAFYARIAENAFLEVDHGVLEASVATGATQSLIVWEVLIPEALPALVRGIAVTLISLISFSAMAGAVGAGGVGDLAIQYGYTVYNPIVILITVIILIIIVQLLQFLGDYLASVFSKK